MTARKAAHSLQRAKGALASGFATVDLHHAGGHDHGGCGDLVVSAARAYDRAALHTLKHPTRTSS